MTDLAASPTIKTGLPSQFGPALAFIGFPALFIAAQILHPDPFAISMPHSGASYIETFNNQASLHWAHLFEFFCAPLLMVMAVHLYGRLRDKVPMIAFIAVVMAGLGSFMLAGNKAALCLTVSAFDLLDDQTLMLMAPGLDLLVQRQAMLAVLWGISLLPLGFALFGFALWRTKSVPVWQWVAILFGSLMLANPEIQAINTMASIILAIGLVPYGLSLLKPQH